MKCEHNTHTLNTLNKFQHSELNSFYSKPLKPLRPEPGSSLKVPAAHGLHSLSEAAPVELPLPFTVWGL